MKRKMNVVDFKIRYNVETYDNFEELLKLEVHELMLMFSLMGYYDNRKIGLNEEDKKNKEHSFSMRTMYNKSSLFFDALFGLISILEFKNLDFKEAFDIAFEKTSDNNVKFLELENVKTSFEYMLGGLDVAKEEFLYIDKKKENIVYAIHDYLTNGSDDDFEMILQMEESFDNE